MSYHRRLLRSEYLSDGIQACVEGEKMFVRFDLRNRR